MLLNYLHKKKKKKVFLFYRQGKEKIIQIYYPFSDKKKPNRTEPKQNNRNKRQQVFNTRRLSTDILPEVTNFHEGEKVGVGEGGGGGRGRTERGAGKERGDGRSGVRP